MIHSLGIHFGVSEWQQDFKKKFEFCESSDFKEEEIEATTENEVKINELEKDKVDKVIL